MDFRFLKFSGMVVLSVAITLGFIGFSSGKSFDNVIDANALLAEELLQRGNYLHARQFLRLNEAEEPFEPLHNERLGLLNMRWARHIETSRSPSIARPYYEEALAEFDKGSEKVATKADELRFSLLKAEALIHLGEHERARQYLEAALNTDPQMNCVYYLFGLSYLYEFHQDEESLVPADVLGGERIHEVERYFSRAIRSESECLSPFAYLIVGLLDYRIGAWDLAKRRLEKGVKEMRMLSETERVGSPSFTPLERMYFDEAVDALDAIKK